jgi:hypothetical protein
MKPFTPNTIVICIEGFFHWLKIGCKYPVRDSGMAGSDLPSGDRSTSDWVSVTGLPDTPPEMPEAECWRASRFRLYNPPKPEQTPERIHHDNPIAKLTDKQLAELDRVTSGEREE